MIHVLRDRSWGDLLISISLRDLISLERCQLAKRKVWSGNFAVIAIRKGYDSGAEEQVRQTIR